MPESKKTTTPLFILIITYLAFISLGLPDGLLGIAWPYMSQRAQVPIENLGILLISFTCGYLATSSTSGKILKIISLGTLLSVSCLITACSLLTYAFVDFWYVLIVASFFLGSGGGAIDASINTFAASKFSASTINWLHAFYGIGATTGPLLVTLLFFVNLPWYFGYITIAIIQISLALLFMLTGKIWKVDSIEETAEENPSYFKTLQLPIVWANILLFFLYTGLEQGFGQWAFTILTKSRGLTEEHAGLWTGFYWGSLTVGRIIFGIILTKIPVQKVLKGGIVGIVLGILLITLDLSNFITLAGIVILGFSNAPIFPSLISVTPERVGKKHSATAIGVQISMAMLGASLLPGFAGLLSDHFGLEIIATVFLVAAVLLLLLYFTSYTAINKKR